MDFDEVVGILTEFLDTAALVVFLDPRARATSYLRAMLDENTILMWKMTEEDEAKDVW